MERKKGLVITGGKAPHVDISVGDREQWLVVAADSGASTAARMNIVPDAIVGDMDSLTDMSLLFRDDSTDVVRYSSAKDWTDTEIALDYVWQRDIEDVTILGGGGGRIDHLMGILALFDREVFPRRWYTDGEELVVITDTVVFEAPEDKLVSLFPLGSEECRMESDGLRWKLDGLRWKRGDIGISNECQDETCRITMLRGRLLMVRRLPSRLVL